MLVRHHLAVAVTTLFLALAVAVAQEVPEPGAPASAESRNRPDTVPGATVKQVVRDAIVALDQLDSVIEQPLLHEGLEAIEDRLTALAALDPNTSWLLYLGARVSALRGRYADAASQLDKFVQTPEGRNEWNAYKILGDLFAETFPRLAKANYEKAAALKPGESNLLMGLSGCAAKLGYRDEALDYARRAVVADSARTATPVAHLARILLRAGRLEEAAQEAARALALAEKDQRSRPGQRQAVQEVHAQRELLVAILTSRSRQAPKDADVYEQLADAVEEQAAAVVQLARFEALAILERGMENTAPNPPVSLVEQLAVLLVELGRTEEATVRFQQLLTADPDNVLAREWFRQTGADVDKTPPPD